jgi:predicted enzyme related to lactoylglutathione lyase
MKVTGFILNATSEQPERLIQFYRDVVGLKPAEGMGPGAFSVDGGTFIVDGHSEVHGAAKEPQRMLINFFVEDIAAEQRRLESQGVKFLRDKGREPWGGIISTFTDPDGNYCQIVEYKPEANAGQ